MNRSIFIGSAFALVFTIFGATTVLASSPAPTPVCNIKGTIESVKSIDAYIDSCLNEPSNCPTDSTNEHSDQYQLDISIDSVSFNSNETANLTCESMYPLGSVQSIYLEKSLVKGQDTFSADKNIEGVVSAKFLKYLTSYSLINRIDTDESVTKKPFMFSPLGISLGAMLVLLVLSGIAYMIILSRRKKVEIEK